MSITSERLAQAMKERKISLRELADMTGYSKSSLAYYTNGSRSMTFDKIKKIAEVLGVSAGWLAGWYDDPQARREEKQPVQRNELPDEEFTRNFSRLTEANQKRILDLMRALLEVQEHQSE